MGKSKQALRSEQRRKAKRQAKRAKVRPAPPRSNPATTSEPPSALAAEVDPARLIRGPADVVGQFMVALAAVFNDLKDLAAFEQPMLPTRPGPEDTSATAGEWRGRHNTLHRFVAGVLHELIELMSSKRKLLDEADIKACVGRLPEDARADWQAIVEIALKVGDENSAMKQTLVYVRNNASFHYMALGEIGKAWKKVFVDDPKTETNRSAVYALGESMETTRFHFADAAFQAVMSRGGDKLRAAQAADGMSLDERLVETAEKVNLALRFLLEEFIHRRTSG